MEQQSVRRGPRAGIRAVALLAVAAAVGGCGSPDSRAPGAFVHRQPLASCGKIHLSQTQVSGGETVPADAWACLDAAFKSGAELVVEMPTSEGAQVVSYYRVGPDIDGMEVFHDATRDRFGSQAWSHELCPDTTTTTEPLGCHNT
jgi:hypothetical protein